MAIDNNNELTMIFFTSIKLKIHNIDHRDLVVTKVIMTDGTLSLIIVIKLHSHQTIICKMHTVNVLYIQLISLNIDTYPHVPGGLYVRGLA